VGLSHRRDIRSLRDLRAEHLPLLRAMAAKGRQAGAGHSSTFRLIVTHFSWHTRRGIMSVSR
jgi:hypothetical protein